MTCAVPVVAYSKPMTQSMSHFPAPSQAHPAPRGAQRSMLHFHSPGNCRFCAGQYARSSLLPVDDPLATMPEPPRPTVLLSSRQLEREWYKLKQHHGLPQQTGTVAPSTKVVMAHFPFLAAWNHSVAQSPSTTTVTPRCAKFHDVSNRFSTSRDATVSLASRTSVFTRSMCLR